MGLRVFSEKKRPVHLGRYRLEKLARQSLIELGTVYPFEQLFYANDNRPDSIVNAMRDHQAMLDAIRDGLINKAMAETPDDLQERANHLKSFGYFADASMVGTCLLPHNAVLEQPYLNPDIARLAEDLRTRQTKTLASGIDLIMADLKESMQAPPTTIDCHAATTFSQTIRPRS